MRRLCTSFYDAPDPADWWGALLFGLVVATIVTTGCRAYLGDGDGAAGETHWAILGGNLAWGIIQGWLHANEAVFERSRVARLVREAAESPDEARAVASIRGEHDPDLAGAVVIFFLVSPAALPPVLALSSIGDVRTAARVSNLCLLLAPFGVGYRWARSATGTNRRAGGFRVTAFGLVTAVIGELLGG